MSAGVVVHDRTKALLLLAGSRYDVYAPGPKVGRTFAHGKAAATVKEPCLLCDGEKVVRDKFGRESTCESCKGRGWHKVDPMIDAKAGSWEEQKQASAGTRRVMCDRCAGAGVWKGERCGMCDGAGKVSVPITRPVLSESDREVDVELSEWERMMLRREDAGSYAEYDRCVAELARRSPHRHAVFHRVHVVKTASAGLLSGTEATELERAVRQLLGWMPHEILVPREIVEAEKRLSKPVKGRGVSQVQRDGRDEEIKAAFRAGAKPKDLAAEYGLSVPRVNEIVYHEREVA
jgi:hypothetical protein